MTDTVYDTTFIAFSNGQLAGRKAGNTMDRRLTRIEEFVNGRRVAWYNDKLLGEYQSKVKQYRNDVIELFFRRLSDAGRRANRSTLAKHNYARARAIRWPTHDHHLLAAAIEAIDPTIFVTEVALGNCAGGAKREFGFSVLCIA